MLSKTLSILVEYNVREIDVVGEAGHTPAHHTCVRIRVYS